LTHGIKTFKAKSWSELPEILEPGTYVVNGRKFVVVKRVERDVMREFLRLVKYIDETYYG